MAPDEFSDAGWEALLQCLPDTVAFVDRSGGILLTNREQELSGLPPSVDMTGLGATAQIFRPDGRRYDLAEWPVLRSVRTGEVIVGEKFFRVAPDGRRRSFSCNCSPFYDGRAAIAGAVVVVRDITEHSRSQEQLAYHASLLDNVEDGVIATDADDFRITAWNRGAERLYGSSAEEVLGRPAREVASFPGDESRLTLERELLERGRTRIEFSAHRKDGSPVEVELIAVEVKDRRGEVCGYLGIHRDITERKRAEQRLRSHAVLLENTEDAVLATDPQFALTAWNQGAERMFGWTADEALGRRACELIPPSFSDEQLASELRALVETGRWRGTATWYGRRGRPVIAEALTVALRPEQGEVTGYVCIMRDLTDLQHARWSLEIRARQQALLAELTLRNLADGDLPALLDDAVVLVARGLQLELATIGEKLSGEQGVAGRAAYGWSAEAVAPAPPSLAAAGSLAGYALIAGEPVISEDVRTDQRFGISELFAEKHPVSAAAVVIPGDSRPFGVLIAAARQRRPFTPEDVDFMKAVANVIGVAVEQAGVTERMEEARANLRTSIARELHDDALRELTDALALAAVARSAPLAADEATRWDGLITVLQRVGQHLRGAVYDLRLTGDEDRDFAALLSDLVDVQGARALGCGVKLSGRGAIPAGSLGRRGTEVLRIVREAITNARLHAGATLITVDAGASTPDILRLEVTDDGRWADRAAETSTERGAGLAGMFERADELGAELRIEGRPEGGTRLSLELPWAKALLDRP